MSRAYLQIFFERQSNRSQSFFIRTNKSGHIPACMDCYQSFLFLHQTHMHSMPPHIHHLIHLQPPR